MLFASLLTILQWIATSVILSTSIIRTSFLVKTNQGRSVKKELYNSKEDSVLRCAQRCTFLLKDAIMKFDELKMSCLCFSSVDEGSLTAKIATDKKSKVFQVKEIKEYKINHALTKPSHQSTTEDLYGKPNNAYFANDGDTATRSATQFNKNENEWWQLDMVGVVKIGLIKILLEPWSLSEGNYKNLTILTRVSGTDPWEKCDVFANPTDLSIETGCQPQRSARFVKIMTFFKKALYLAEVEVYE